MDRDGWRPWLRPENRWHQADNGTMMQESMAWGMEQSAPLTLALIFSGFSHRFTMSGWIRKVLFLFEVVFP